MIIIETAAELYRELKSLGLHLRKGNGRDNELLDTLAGRLGCSFDKLQSYLDSSDIRAEVFLLHFLEIAEPFSKMYQEIWQFLGDQKAPEATESLSVRFGFENDDSKVSVNLDEFREQITRITNLETEILQRQWPYTAVSRLFQVSPILLNDVKTDGFRHQRYHVGEPLPLPVPKLSNHPFDQIVLEIRNVFQLTIDNAVGINGGYRDYIYILTDLVPVWYDIFDNLSKLPKTGKDGAFQYYQGNIEPLIEVYRNTVSQVISELLDILTLPFWKHRWHMYEVWCTVRALNALEDFHPVLRIKDRRLPIDGYESGIVADLRSADFPRACIGLQCQTAYVSGKRKAIKPDLRVLFDQRTDVLESTALVVEYKQHNRLNKSYVEEIMHSYTEGCPKSGGLIVVNYDEPELKATCPAGASLLTGFHPGNPYTIRRFNELILDAMGNAGFQIGGTRVLLLDVSGSMIDRYDKITELLLALGRRDDVEIYHFNDQIKDKEVSITGLPLVGGYTDREKALEQLYRLKGHLKEIIVVSDEMLEIDRTPNVEKIHECFPDYLASLLTRLNW